MNEIEFRVWDGKVMWYRGSLQIDMMPFDLTKRAFFEFEGVESGEIVVGEGIRDFILMLYTTLTDKDGKKIYEGDIIKCVADNDLKWPAKGVVEYLPSSAGFAINVGRQSLDNDNCYYAHFWSHTDFEVIGNIYENPDLLN